MKDPVKHDRVTPHCPARRAAWLLLAVAAPACSSQGGGTEGSGSLTVLVEAEEVIVDGLEPGDEVENVQDGWAVSFDRYLVALGDIRVRLATDQDAEAAAPEIFVVDLTEVPAAGLPLWTIDGLQAGRWDFSYATPGASDGATAHETVSAESFDTLRENGWTYLIEGQLEKADGRSCPPPDLADVPHEVMPDGTNDAGDDCYDNPNIRFSFGATAKTRFGPCEIDGVQGFAVTAGGMQTVAATIHGDHVFFNGFPEGGEGGVLRLAQWLADSDLNLDGMVTRDELEAIAPAALSEIDDRYQLGGSPVTPLDSMVEYLRAQLKTQGHFQGEGECALNGAAHQDGHE